jgi:hypothetical protein
MSKILEVSRKIGRNVEVEQVTLYTRCRFERTSTVSRLGSFFQLPSFVTGSLSLRDKSVNYELFNKAKLLCQIGQLIHNM